MITLVSYIDDYTLLFYFGEGGGAALVAHPPPFPRAPNSPAWLCMGADHDLQYLQGVEVAAHDLRHLLLAISIVNSCAINIFEKVVQTNKKTYIQP